MEWMNLNECCLKANVCILNVAQTLLSRKWVKQHKFVEGRTWRK